MVSNVSGTRPGASRTPEISAGSKQGASSELPGWSGNSALDPRPASAASSPLPTAIAKRATALVLHSKNVQPTASTHAGSTYQRPDARRVPHQITRMRDPVRFLRPGRHSAGHLPADWGNQSAGFHLPAEDEEARRERG